MTQQNKETKTKTIKTKTFDIIQESLTTRILPRPLAAGGGGSGRARRILTHLKTTATLTTAPSTIVAISRMDRDIHFPAVVIGLFFFGGHGCDRAGQSG